MYVAVDETWKDRKAPRVYYVRVTWNLGARALAGECHTSVLAEDDDLASGLACGRVEEGVGVDSPNHGPILVRFPHPARSRRR